MDTEVLATVNADTDEVPEKRELPPRVKANKDDGEVVAIPTLP